MQFLLLQVPLRYLWGLILVLIFSSAEFASIYLAEYRGTSPAIWKWYLSLTFCLKLSVCQWPGAGGSQSPASGPGHTCTSRVPPFEDFERLVTGLSIQSTGCSTALGVWESLLPSKLHAMCSGGKPAVIRFFLNVVYFHFHKNRTIKFRRSVQEAHVIL